MNAQQAITRRYDHDEELTAGTVCIGHYRGSVEATTRPADDNVAVLREAWTPLRRRAHYLARNRLDADDLMASAVAATWEKWVKGTGPSTNIVAYITQSMRNRVIDELRSPRTSEVALDAVVMHPAHIDDRSRIDHHVENTQIRAAVHRLPENMQRVLIDIVVDGRKPRDLEDEYHMTAPAISTAAYRAKKLLRCELFLEVVRGSCNLAGCALPQLTAARELGRSAEISSSNAQFDLLRQCGDCATGFDRYINMSYQGAA